LVTVTRLVHHFPLYVALLFPVPLMSPSFLSYVLLDWRHFDITLPVKLDDGFNYPPNPFSVFPSQRLMGTLSILLHIRPCAPPAWFLQSENLPPTAGLCHHDCFLSSPISFSSPQRLVLPRCVSASSLTPALHRLCSPSTPLFTAPVDSCPCYHGFS